MDRTNMFFLAVGAGFGYFIFREYQKQKAAQRKLQRQQTAAVSGLGAYDPGYGVMDYAERIDAGYL